jgi:hypothetical protein
MSSADYPGSSVPSPDPVPDVLTMDDIMNDHGVILAKEQADRSLIESIGTTSVLSLKPKFVEWYSKGCPPCYPIFSITVVPPAQCSDGVSRSMQEYVEFCTGQPIPYHVSLFQAKLPDIQVSFANFNGSIAVVVSKA